MDDFIFGSLATDALRLDHLRSLWAGVTHSHHRLPRDPEPDQTIQLELTIGPALPSDRAWVYWTTDGSDPAGSAGTASCGHVLPMEAAGSEWNTLLWGYIQHFRIVLPGQPAGTLLRYRLSAYSPAEGELFADNGQYYACYIAYDPSPAWAKDAVVYHIFIDRFYPGPGQRWRKEKDLNGFMGGRLEGITARLDYISDLGVNVLYLSPIFPSPSHHGYDTTDFFGIEPRLGNLEDFQDLLIAAHQRQLRVVLDFVPNHCSNEHPVFQDAIHNPNSVYRDWFTFEHWPDQYATFFGVCTLPQLNLRCPPARQHILDAASYWLKLGVDGFRLDYAIGPAVDFWAAFRQTTRTVKPDCWTFGEVVNPPDAQLAFEGGLDGCLDFVLLEGLRQAFAFRHWNASQLGAFLNRHEAFFPEAFSRPCFLDNHDMNRFIWAAGGDLRRLKLAAMCQFTLSGAPLVYYGTEVGLSQARDVRQEGLGLPHESRQPMLWGKAQDEELLHYYQALIKLRRQEASLRNGSRETLFADQAVLAYVRSLGEDKVATLLNLSDEVRQVTIAGDWDAILLATHNECRVEKVPEGVCVTLAPVSGVIIKTG